MPTVRTKMQPAVPVEVSDAELVDLKRWDLVAEGAPQDRAPSTPATPKPGKAPLNKRED